MSCCTSQSSLPFFEDTEADTQVDSNVIGYPGLQFPSNYTAAFISAEDGAFVRRYFQPPFTESYISSSSFGKSRNTSPSD